jgi:hypothetical protein
MGGIGVRGGCELAGKGCRRVAVGALLAVLVLLFTAAAASATTITVTTGADGSTPGTLRYAVNQACSGDTIVIEPGVNPILTSALAIKQPWRHRGDD